MARAYALVITDQQLDAMLDNPILFAPPGKDDEAKPLQRNSVDAYFAILREACGITLPNSAAYQAWRRRADH